MKILVVEPTQVGYSHELVNLQSLISVGANNEEADLYFLADRSIYTNIVGNFPSHIEFIKKFNFLDIRVRNKTYSIQNLFDRFRMLRKIEKLRAHSIHFLSSDTELLIALVILRTLGHLKNVKIRICIHGILETIEHNRFKNLLKLYKWGLEFHPMRFVLYFPMVLKFAKRYDFNFYVLSPHILNNMERNFSEYVSERWSSTTMPTPTFNGIARHNSKSNVNIKIGLIGRPNMQNFYKLFDICVEFKIVALKFVVNGPKFEKVKDSNLIDFDPRAKLSRQAIDERFSDVDFFLYLPEPYEYEYKCSGAFFEAIYFNKPVIFLSNPHLNFLNEYTSLPIGIECQNLNRVAEILKEIIESRITAGDFVFGLQEMRMLARGEKLC